MPTRNISLTEHLDRFVDESVASGRFQNASAVVREGLRLLEAKTRGEALRRERLRAAEQEAAGLLD